jgi:ribosomal protein S18 acetylase RimI-like enzyme
MGAVITVQLVTAWDEHEIADLYRAGGWWKEEYQETEIPLLIRGSFLFAVAIHETSGRAVGMGRVLSDGISDAYIQDLVVLPSCRGTGVGKEIVQILVSRCKEKGISWIGLIAEPNTEEFYKPLGFSPMNGYVPLLYQGENGC